MTDTAKIIEITDAVVADLNTAKFSQAFTASREYVPAAELPDLETLRVAVVPKGLASEPASRSEQAVIHQVDVGVQKKLPAEASAVKAMADGMMLLVQEIVTFFNRHTPSNAGVTWVSTENDPIFLPEHFEELRQFTSVLTVSYQEIG